jgi:putative transposase
MSQRFPPKVTFLFESTRSLTEVLRDGARKLVVQAVEAKFENFLLEVSERLEDGRSRIVRNGYLPKRDILTGIGQVSIQIPRVRDRAEEKEKISFIEIDSTVYETNSDAR